MSSSSTTLRSRRRAHLRGFFAGLGFTGALLALLFAIFGPGGADVITATGEPAVTAATLDELTARSSLVIEAKVVERRPGRIVGEDVDPQETHEQIRMDQVVLEVIEVLAGSGAAVGDRVVFEEIVGFVDDPRPIVFEGAAAAARVGDRGLYFLVQEAGQPALRLTTPDSRLLISEGRFIPEDRMTPAVEGLEVMDPEEVARLVRTRASLIGTQRPPRMLED